MSGQPGGGSRMPADRMPQFNEDQLGYAPGDRTGSLDMARRQASLQANRQWQQEQAAANQPQAYHMPSFHMPSFHMPDYSALAAQQQQSYADALAQQRRAQGIADRDQLYSNYLSAAESATDYVNAQITKERSQAMLLGVDPPEITDEIKQTRISNYFASIWGEGDQTQLENLMAEYGNPEGFTDWLVTRGVDTTGGQEAGSDTTVGGSQGLRPKMILDDEEEETLGASSNILGV